MSKTVKEYNDELRQIGVKVRLAEDAPAPVSETEYVRLVCANCGEPLNESAATVEKAKRGDFWCSHCYPKGAENN